MLLTAHLIIKAAVLLPNPPLPEAASDSPAEQQPGSALGDSPRGCRECLGMGWGGGMMKPGTGDWEWCVITVLVLSPPLWPGPCVKGDTAAWVLWGDQESPILTLAWLSFLQELPSPHPSC